MFFGIQFKIAPSIVLHIFKGDVGKECICIFLSVNIDTSSIQKIFTLKQLVDG